MFENVFNVSTTYQMHLNTIDFNILFNVFNNAINLYNENFEQFFFLDFHNIIIKTFLKYDDWIFFLMHLLKKKYICLMTTRINYRNVLLMILLILNILFKLTLWMIFIISARRVINASSSINEKLLNFIISFMNIVNKNEEWILNMISILFCVVVINFSCFFNDKMIVYNIIFSCIFDWFHDFKELFEIIFWNLHYCSKIVLFM